MRTQQFDSNLQKSFAHCPNDRTVTISAYNIVLLSVESVLQMYMQQICSTVRIRC